jgi:hypothetical protein
MIFGHVYRTDVMGIVFICDGVIKCGHIPHDFPANDVILISCSVILISCSVILISCSGVIVYGDMGKVRFCLIPCRRTVFLAGPVSNTKIFSCVSYGGWSRLENPFFDME